jgi:predicted nucleotide-binding protein (sugar kinase/HSP70/actin superfamily)
MESHGKPYLILQLDEHDSSVGYETRIEAAIRSFKNHHFSSARDKAIKFSPLLFPSKDKKIWDKTLIIPNWDNITLKLVAANLKRVGVDARIMEQSETIIRKSLRHNTGQCIPINIIAQEFVDYVKAHNLDPANTLLWMVFSKIACNIGLYPHHLETIIHSFGNGMEKSGVYAGPISFIDISMRLPVNTYFAYMFGGLTRKMGCKTRPYEKEKGATDKVIEKSIGIFVDAFLGLRSKEDAVAQVVSCFEGIDVSNEQRPKVAIFGDLYVRDNELINQDLTHFIEDNNGEVIVTPYTDYVRMIARVYFKKWLIEGNYLEVLYSKALLATVAKMQKTYLKYFQRILADLGPRYNERPQNILSQYNIRIEHTGESMDNILKIFYLTKHYPDLSLFVQTSPAFCCPSLITEAMAKDIEKNTGVPIVSITYDGTAGNKNDAIIPYLKYPRESW